MLTKIISFHSTCSMTSLAFSEEFQQIIEREPVLTKDLVELYKKGKALPPSSETEKKLEDIAMILFALTQVLLSDASTLSTESSTIDDFARTVEVKREGAVLLEFLSVVPSKVGDEIFDGLSDQVQPLMRHSSSVQQFFTDKLGVYVGKLKDTIRRERILPEEMVVLSIEGKALLNTKRDDLPQEITIFLEKTTKKVNLVFGKLYSRMTEHIISQSTDFLKNPANFGNDERREELIAFGKAALGLTDDGSNPYIGKEEEGDEMVIRLDQVKSLITDLETTSIIQKHVISDGMVNLQSLWPELQDRYEELSYSQARLVSSVMPEITPANFDFMRGIMHHKPQRAYPGIEPPLYYLDCPASQDVDVLKMQETMSASLVPGFGEYSCLAHCYPDPIHHETFVKGFLALNVSVSVDLLGDELTKAGQPELNQRWYPTAKDDQKKYNGVDIFCKDVRESVCGISGFTKYTLEVHDSPDPRSVIVYAYSEWADFSATPIEDVSMIAEEIFSNHKTLFTDPGSAPMAINCRAGVGRTGTLFSILNSRAESAFAPQEDIPVEAHFVVGRFVRNFQFGQRSPQVQLAKAYKGKVIPIISELSQRLEPLLEKGVDLSDSSTTKELLEWFESAKVYIADQAWEHNADEDEPLSALETYPGLRRIMNAPLLKQCDRVSGEIEVRKATALVRLNNLDTMTAKELSDFRDECELFIKYPSDNVRVTQEIEGKFRLITDKLLVISYASDSDEDFELEVVLDPEEDLEPEIVLESVEVSSQPIQPVPKPRSKNRTTLPPASGARSVRKPVPKPRPRPKPGANSGQSSSSGASSVRKPVPKPRPERRANSGQSSSSGASSVRKPVPKPRPKPRANSDQGSASGASRAIRPVPRPR